MDREQDQRHPKSFISKTPETLPGWRNAPEVCDLGLDISTSVIGVCLLDHETHRVIKAGWIDLVKVEGFWSKLDKVQEFLKRDVMHVPYECLVVRNVFVEEPALRFSRGGSSATTMALLQRFNGAVCSVLRDMLPRSTTWRYVNVATARKLVGIKLNKADKTRTTKEQVVAYAQNHPLGKDLPWTYHKAPTGRWKGLQVVDHPCEDMADSWVVCYGGQCSGGKPW